MKRPVMLRLLMLCALLPVAQASAQMPRIGIIDLYGNRSVGENALRNALGLRVGDSISISRDSLVSRLLRLRGVRNADVAAVCCEDGRTILYVGIDELGTSVTKAATIPSGKVRLPQSMLDAEQTFMHAMVEGVQKGIAGEDDSRGYTLYAYAPARAAQHPLLTYAAQHANVLRDVLAHSADAEHRAIAAQLLPYAGATQRAIDDLATSMGDPTETVRNNAMRALGVLAAYARANPALNLRVPVTRFSQMLNSIVWTDRNKAAFALMPLTESRDATLLQDLANTSMSALADMARWKSPGHAMPALVILARIAGIPDDSIFPMIQADPKTVIDAALAKTTIAPWP